MAGKSPQLAITIIANTEALIKNLEAGRGAIEKYGPTVAKMQEDWKRHGAMIVEQAAKVAAAMQGVDAKTLAASDSAKNLKQLETAIAQLAKAGQPVPAIFESTAARLREVTQPVQGFTDKIQGAWTTVSGFAGAFGLGLGINELVGFGRSILETAGHVGDLSQRLGTSAEFVQRMSYAANQGGASFDDVGTAVAKMNATLSEGSQGTIDILKKAGLSFANIRSMKPEDAFYAIADAIKDIEDPMLQAEAAVKLFGKGGQVLLPAMKDDMRRVGEQAVIMSDQTVAKLKAISDAMQRVKDSAVAVGGNVIVEAADNWRKWAVDIGGVRGAFVVAMVAAYDYADSLLEVERVQRQMAGTTFKNPLVGMVAGQGPIIPTNYIEQVAMATMEIRKLSTVDREQIDAALALGTTMDDLRGQYGLTANAAKLYSSVAADDKAKQKEVKDQLDKHRDALAAVKHALGGVSGAEYSAIKIHLDALTVGGKLIVNEEVIANAYGFSAEAVKIVAAAEADRVRKAKDNSKVITDALKKADDDARGIQDKYFKDLGASTEKVTKFQIDQIAKGLDAANKAGDKYLDTVSTVTERTISAAARQRDESLLAIKPLEKQMPEIYERARVAIQAVFDRQVGDAKTAAEVTTAETAHAGAIAFNKSFSGAVGNIGDSIVRAIEGGGNVLRAAFASLGNSLAKALSAGYVAALKSSGMSEANQAISGASLTVGFGLFLGVVSQIIDSFKSTTREINNTEKAVQALNVRFKALGTTGVAVSAALASAISAVVAGGGAAARAIEQVSTGRGRSSPGGAMDELIAKFSDFKTKLELEKEATQWKLAYDSMLASGAYTAATLLEIWQKYEDARKAAIGAVEVDTRPEGARGFPTKAELQKAAGDAKAAYDYMLASGLYTSDVLEQAWQTWQDSMVTASGVGTEAMKKLDSQIKSLTDSIATEAPEAVMGVIEKDQRRQLAELEKQKADLTEKYKAAGDAVKDSLDTVSGKAVEVQKDIAHIFSQPLTIPYVFVPQNAPMRGYSAGGVVPQYLAAGGEAMGRLLSFRPRGTDTVPAMLTPGEGVVNTRGMAYLGTGGLAAINNAPASSPASGGSMTVQLVLSDGRVLADAVVPWIPGAVKRYGLKAS